MLRPAAPAAGQAGQAGQGAAPGNAGAAATGTTATGTPATQSRDDAAFRAETGRVLTNVIRNRELTSADRTYLAGQLASRYNIPQAEAEKRWTRRS